jgi:ubiquinone biosynthesis protein UbiJ
MDPAAALANRILDDQTWARQRLAAHAGQVFAVVIGPFPHAVRIDASGSVESTPLAGGAPDLTLTLAPLAVPALLANPARWGEFVTTSGDPGLAATLQDVAQALPWFAERVLADALGPIVGLRVADAGRRLLALPEHAAPRPLPPPPCRDDRAAGASSRFPLQSAGCASCASPRSSASRSSTGSTNS